MATKLNPVVYLVIAGFEYRWSLETIDDPDCDAAMLRDFAKENPYAAREIRNQITCGLRAGKVRVMP